MLSHIKSILAFPIFLWVSDSFLTILDLDSFWAFAKILCNAQSFLTITIFLWISDSFLTIEVFLDFRLILNDCEVCAILSHA